MIRPTPYRLKFSRSCPWWHGWKFYVGYTEQSAQFSSETLHSWKIEIATPWGGFNLGRRLLDVPDPIYGPAGERLRAASTWDDYMRTS